MVETKIYHPWDGQEKAVRLPVKEGVEFEFVERPDALSNWWAKDMDGNWWTLYGEEWHLMIAKEEDK